MRASGHDPAKTQEAKAKQAARSREVMLANRAWEREHGRVFDVERYESEILPLVRSITISALAHATALSDFYLWRVRKGERRLHPRHWESVRRSVRVIENAHDGIDVASETRSPPRPPMTPDE
jgi:hypothetical protein